MKLTFPAGKIVIIKSSNGLTLYRRQLNATAIYFVSFFGTVIHCGKRKHCTTMFNYYRPGVRTLATAS